MKQLLDVISRVAASKAPVLFHGESGTGKEMLARRLHQQSGRRGSFVAVNCAAITESLLETELFGHVKGAFTGAVATRKGLFEEACGGTLFLDEITESSLGFQGRLLRALQNREIRPVGSSQTVEIDTRVVAATNRTLTDAVRAGVFREDLAYRLAVVPLKVPALRERREDIPELARAFVARACALNQRTAHHLSEPLLRALTAYDWPGNVRELENDIERAVLLSPGEEIDARFLLPAEWKHTALRDAGRAALEQVERERISEALAEAQGNKVRAAQLLRISRATLYKRLHRYGLGSTLTPPTGTPLAALAPEPQPLSAPPASPARR